MGFSVIKCEGYSGVLERAGSYGEVSADDFSLGEGAKEKLMYVAAIAASVAWAGYWIMGTPTRSELCGHSNDNNQSNATHGNVSVHENIGCKKDDDGGIAVPPLIYAHYP